MRRGLDGRRIALFAGGTGKPLAAALTQAGAQVESLSDGVSHGEAEWHSGRYAAVVVCDARDDELQEKVVQLLRESLLSGKPIVLTEGAIPVMERAGGTAQDAVLVLRGRLDEDKSREAVRVLADCLEEGEVDEMSDLSFPASDPPAAHPSSIGPRHDEPEVR